jgi:hypothetical protein
VQNAHNLIPSPPLLPPHAGHIWELNSAREVTPQAYLSVGEARGACLPPRRGAHPPPHQGVRPLLHRGAHLPPHQGSAPALASRGAPMAAPPAAPCSGHHLRPTARLPSLRKVWRRDNGGTAGLAPPVAAADGALEASHDDRGSSLSSRRQRLSERWSSTGVRGEPLRWDGHGNIRA